MYDLASLIILMKIKAYNNSKYISAVVKYMHRNEIDFLKLKNVAFLKSFYICIYSFVRS